MMTLVEKDDTSFFIHKGRYLVYLLISVLVFQAITTIEILPITFISLLFGVSSMSPTHFFVYPILYFIGRFLLFFISAFHGVANTSEASANKFVRAPVSFLIDFFYWVYAMMFAFSLSLSFKTIGLIPSLSGDGYFFSILNLYVAAFLVVLLWKGNRESNFFEYIKQTVGKKPLYGHEMSHEESVEYLRSIVKMFFKTALFFMFPILLGLFSMVVLGPVFWILKTVFQVVLSLLG